MSYSRMREEESRLMPSTVATLRLLLTGRRMSEIRDLRWKYVRDDCIELPDAETGGRVVPLGRGGPRRAGGASPRGRQPWGETAGKLPGSHLTGLQTPLATHPGARRAGRRARIHDLRHSFASRALALGEGLTMIGKLLGHTQVQTTARYAHLVRDSIQRVTARVTGSVDQNP